MKTLVTAAAAALIVLPTFVIQAQAQDATDHPVRSSRSRPDTSNQQQGMGDVGMRQGDKCWIAASNAPVTNMGYWADCPKPKR